MFDRFRKEAGIIIRNPDKYIPEVVRKIQEKIEEVFTACDPKDLHTSPDGNRREWRGKIDSEFFPESLSTQLSIRHEKDKNTYEVSWVYIDKDRNPNTQISETYTLSPITVFHADHLTREQFYLRANSPYIKKLTNTIAYVKQHIESSRQAGGQARPKKG